MKKTYRQRLLIAFVGGIAAAGMGALISYLNHEAIDKMDLLFDFCLWIVLGWFIAKYSQKEAAKERKGKK